MRLSASPSLKLMLLSAASLGLLASFQPAIAADGAKEVAEVVVAGQRKGTLRALKEQKESLTVANVISAEELQVQPTANLADLLSRMPGLSSAVDQSRNQAGTGEAQYVTIRGLDSSWNAYSLNGVRLAQTDASSRAISMNLLSPFALSFVRVDKAPTSEMDGDAIAGTVDFRTASGFDFGTKYNRLSVQGQFADRADERGVDAGGYTVQYEGARTFGQNQEFAIYGNVYYQDKSNAGESRALQQDYQKMTPNAPGLVRDQGTNVYAMGPQWNFYRNTVTRQGATLSLDYRTENQKLYLRANYGQFHLETNMDQSSARQGLATHPCASETNPEDYKACLVKKKDLIDFLTSARPSSSWQSDGPADPKGNTVKYGAIPGQYSRTEHTNQKLINVLVGGETKMDAFVLDYAASYSKGRTDYPFRLQAGFYAFPWIGTADQGGQAQVPFITDFKGDKKDPRAVLPADGLKYLARTDLTRQWYTSYGWEYAWEQKSEVKANLAWNLKSGIFDQLKAGFKYETADRESNNVATDDENRFYFYKKDANGNWTTNPDLLGSGSNRWAAQGDYLFNLPGKTLTSFMGGGLQVPMRLVDPEYLKAQALRYAATVKMDPSVYYKNLVRGTEDRASAYVQAVLKPTPQITVVPGLRYEYNAYDASYYGTDKQKVPDPANPGKTKDVEALNLKASSRNYDILLPSVVASYRPDEQTVVRASIRRSYTRPSFDSLVGPTSVSKDPDGKVIAISIPNPNLKPITSIDYDLEVQRYDNAGGFVGVALYYKQLKNVIFATGSTNTGADFNSDTKTVKNAEGAEINQLQNGYGGYVRGIELSGRKRFTFLPDFWSGFGVAGNVTLQKTDGFVETPYKRHVRLINAPESIYNASVFYNRGAIRAELAYNRIGRILKDIRGNNNDTWVQPMQRLNFNANYQFNNGLKLGVAVENILNDQSYWATEGKKTDLLSYDRKGGYVETGRTFLVTGTYTF